MEQHWTVYILSDGCSVSVPNGENLFEVLRRQGLAPEAPCGGHGKCGKCTVCVDGAAVLACQTAVCRDMTVTVPKQGGDTSILTEGLECRRTGTPVRAGVLLAFDIGTTTIAGYLLDEQGTQLASASMLNPQKAFGADVVSRLQAAISGKLEALTASVRDGLEELTQELCRKSGRLPRDIGTVCVVGNPCMQQLFLGISPKNLAEIPFTPILTRTQVQRADAFLPLWGDAALLTVPDISGYVGADTMACVIATELDQAQAWTLLVDIGTNGEMVLGCRKRMVACSTAAGPALEGANIRFGMRGAAGAIDHVWLENGQFRCSVIGGGKAVGICGSGLIDAVACCLDAGFLNQRGRIQTTEELDGARIVRLTKEVYLTQEDIRQVQLAKGAIAAGIQLMARELSIELRQIHQVLLAGAFGSFLSPDSACKIGLLPRALQGRIQAVGNAAGSGAKAMACSKAEFVKTDVLRERIQALELGSVPGFQHEFAKQMRF